MTKRDEESWQGHFARAASRVWVAFPQALINTLEGIMKLQVYTPAERIEMMKWAMDAYNDALKEASSNAESMPD